MFWFYLVIASNFLFAVVFALDKILVKKFFSPLKYALAVGGLEGLAVLLIPFFDFVPLSGKIILASAASGICFFSGIYFFFKALLKYEASWATPLLYGVFAPILTFVFGRLFLNEALTSFQLFALLFLIAGGFLLSFSRRYEFSAFFHLFIAGFFISFDFIFLKVVFNNVDFLSGYVLSRLGGFLTAAIVFLINFRSIVMPEAPKIETKPFFARAKKAVSGQIGKLLIFKQVLAFIANFILIYTVSLASPVIVNGMAGMRYAFLIVLAAVLSKKWPSLMDEPMSFWSVLKKSIAVLLIIFGVLILLIKPVETPGVKVWGIDFSFLYAKQLGIDGREVLTAVLNDLKAKNFRLSAYWPGIEKTEDRYDFSELDFQVNEIEKAGGKIILAVGKRLPRWPECHEPEWVRNQKSNVKNQKLLNYIEAVINRYKDSPAIWAWQVENEPFLWGFGECPYVDDEFLDEEIALVKKLDGKRPIILTDSGEFGRWFRAYKRADIFGTTMYRLVWSRFAPGDGYFKYPLEPEYFKVKARIMETIFGKKPIIGIELQAEPWLKKRPPEVPLDEQFKVFDMSQFRENIDYAKTVGFEQNYLWGVEWWYWLKTRQNNHDFWEEAKKLFKNN